jgi:SOS-response transcriptional repressor LexA
VGTRNGLTPWILRTRAVELAGYLPGDVLVLDLNATPQPGDIVCAQVYDWSSRNRTETVVRVYDRAPPIELLVARSIEHHQPIVIDGERVVVKGVFLPHRLRPKTA